MLAKELNSKEAENIFPFRKVSAVYRQVRSSLCVLPLAPRSLFHQCSWVILKAFRLNVLDRDQYPGEEPRDGAVSKLAKRGFQNANLEELKSILRELESFRYDVV